MRALMKRKIAKSVVRCLLAALFLESVLFPGRSFAGNYTDLQKRIAVVATMITEETADIVLLTQILDNIEDTIDVTKEKDERDDENYERDHEPLESGETVWEDVSPSIRSVYAILDASGAMSYAGASDVERKFLEQNPEYGAGLSGSADFPERYKARVEIWQEYIKGVLEANGHEAEEIAERAEVIAELRNISYGAGYYREAMQAGDQISTFVDQEFTRLRSDIQRHLDAETKYALNEQQERDGEMAAFEGAVRTWKTQSQGRDY
jgi:P-type conjugative transfer protein TrbJ